jgi:Holliday junction resolvase RusA-like endonuclease
MAYTPSKTRRYEDLIRLEGGRAMEGRELLAGPLAVEVRAYLAIPQSKSKAWKAGALSGEVRPTTRPDCDNFAKVVDGLNGIAWHDDAQIVSLLVEKHYSQRPRLELTATEIDAHLMGGRMVA